MDLKKIALVLCVMGLTNVASAGGFMPAPSCENKPVSVPCEHSGWDFGLTGYWGRLASDHMDVDANGGNSIQSNLLHVTPGYRFGFGVEGSYHWGNGHDLVVGWTHFNKTFEERGFISDDGAIFADDEDAFFNNAQFKFDTWNFALGQNIDVGPKWDMRVHAGVQYVKIDRELEYLFASLDNFDAGDFFELTTHTRFSGTGPRAGIDGAYHVTDNWSLIGNGAVSVIAGDLNGKHDQVSYNNHIVDTVREYFYGHAHSMVVGLDGRVGLRYDQPVSSGVMSVTGGFAGAVYSNTVAAPTFEDPEDDWFLGNFGVGSFFLTAKYTS